MKGETEGPALSLSERFIAGIRRDARKRVQWVLPHQTDEENLQMGIGNMHGLFLAKYPEFEKFLEERVDGEIGVKRDKVKEAEEVLHGAVGKFDLFVKVFGSSPAKNIPYFHSSFQHALNASFVPWGLSLTFSHKPQGYWTEGRVVQQARTFHAQHGVLTLEALGSHGPQGLVSAIDKFGGLEKMRMQLGVEGSKKPIGYWTTENILEEARAFLRDHEHISTPILLANGRADLQDAIATHYKGGIRQLKTDLGVENNYTRWTPTLVAEQAFALYREHGKLTTQLIRQCGKHALLAAIYAHFEGIEQLRTHLGVSKNGQTAESESGLEDPDKYFDSFVEKVHE